MSVGSVDFCYVALGLSQRSWLVGYLLPSSKKVQTLTVAGGDANALLGTLAKIGNKIEPTCLQRHVDRAFAYVSGRATMAFGSLVSFWIVVSIRQFWILQAFWFHDGDGAGRLTALMSKPWFFTLKAYQGSFAGGGGILR